MRWLDRLLRAIEDIGPSVRMTMPIRDIPDFILDTEKPLACPSCGSTAPAFSLALLRNWVLRDGKLVAAVTGERVACQQIGCGHQYSVGPTGTWKHNPTAQPITQAPPNVPRGAPAQPEEAEATMPPPRMPPRV